MLSTFSGAQLRNSKSWATTRAPFFNCLSKISCTLLLIGSASRYTVTTSAELSVCFHSSHLTTRAIFLVSPLCVVNAQLRARRNENLYMGKLNRTLNAQASLAAQAFLSIFSTQPVENSAEISYRLAPKGRFYSFFHTLHIS